MSLQKSAGGNINNSNRYRHYSNDDSFGENQFSPKEIELKENALDSDEESLMGFPKELPKEKSCWTKCCADLGLEETRVLQLTGETVPRRFPSNKINNQKYNIFNFVFKVLYNEFKFFFNLFFLVIALSQFIEPLRVGFLFTYIAPLTIVLLITMIKEAFDDFSRFRRDKAINLAQYKVFEKGAWKDKYSQDLKVGNLVKVNQNERIPADLICCYTTEAKGTIFIRTDQLDGETDWKLRRAIGFIQHKGTPDNIPSLLGEIVANPPTNQIYEFLGYYENKAYAIKEPLNLEHTLWSNTVLASSGYIIGMVVYTGTHARSAMNSKSPSSKFGRVDCEINKLSKILFCMMILFAGCIIALDGIKGQFYIKFFRFLLLLSSIIPISLRVNLDLAKIWYSYCIDSDSAIFETKTRNSNIPEELGRIQWLLSDKTGTLTQNDMILRKISMEFSNFSVETMHEVSELLRANCNNHNGPLGDFDVKAINENENAKVKMKKRRDPEYTVRDLFTALAICHNVTPTYNNDGVREFQASSPDEVALVKFADSMGMELIERDESKIIIKNLNNVTEEYKVLANFPFSSESKRMGIIVEHKLTGKLIFYMKGAEVVVIEKTRASQRSIVQEACENLGMEGLRTLVICQKVISKEEFENWNSKYNEAQSSLQNRDANVQAVIELLEKDMELLGVTGVEDKLQENVQITIESLRNAGINIWMLTGDKVETATCIAISAGLKSKSQRFCFLKNVRNEDEIKLTINSGNEANTCLVIDGTTLDTCLRSTYIEQEFINYASKCPAVLVCRCSPTQKAIITKKMKEMLDKTVASVGDGGNDVAMIQESNVGIGIVGKEGLQASLAADFSISQFSHLRELILWHGRLSYKRTASLAQFVIHRGLIISVIQAVFSIVFYFVAIPIYNGYLMLGYATVYTSLPVFSLVFDTDCDKAAVLKFPPLYKTLQKGRMLTFKTFLIWAWKSIYQGSVILMFSVQFFNDSFVNIVTITFSALITIELLNVYTEINRFDKKMFLVLSATAAIYFISIWIFRNYFDLGYIDFLFVVKIALIVAIAWLPLHLIKKIVELCDPSEHQKLEE